MTTTTQRRSGGRRPRRLTAKPSGQAPATRHRLLMLARRFAIHQGRFARIHPRVLALDSPEHLTDGERRRMRAWHEGLERDYLAAFSNLLDLMNGRRVSALACGEAIIVRVPSDPESCLVGVPATSHTLAIVASDGVVNFEEGGKAVSREIKVGRIGHLWIARLFVDGAYVAGRESRRLSSAIGKLVLEEGARLGITVSEPEFDDDAAPAERGGRR